MNLLKFSVGNAKLSLNTLIFSLPAGHACPAALLCKSQADRVTGKVTDGSSCQFRCFGATSEARSSALRKSVWRNWELLQDAKTSDAMAQLIKESIGDWEGLVRIHSTGGDYFSKAYFEAWSKVAASRPGKVEYFNGKPYVVGSLFYGYSKMNEFLLQERPDNFRIVASRGGLYDHLIDRYGLQEARVVMSEEEAEELDLEIDHDDTHVWAQDKSFALLLHGTQPKGSKASEAIKTMKANGQFSGYSKKRSRKEVMA